MRGTGFVRGLERTVERSIASVTHIGAALGRDLPDEAMIARPIWVTDQGATEACTAHMGIRAIYGLTGEKCSPAVPWWAARLCDRPGEPLQNVGVSMAAFLSGLGEHGAAPEGVGPEIGPLEDPPALARQLAQQGKRNLELVPVWGTGSMVLAAVRAALADGLPVGIALMADKEYREAKGGRVGPEMGNPDEDGMHEVVLWGFRSADFWHSGSWGLGYGVAGCAWLDESRIANSPSIVIAKAVS